MIYEKPTASKALGIEFSARTFKGALLFEKDKTVFIEKVFETHSASSQGEGREDVKPLYIQESLSPLQSLSTETVVVSGLDTAEVFVRPLEIKLKKEKDIDAVFAFQAEPLLPYPLEKAVTDKILLSKTESGSQFTLLAAKKDHIKHHLEKWSLLNLNPEVVGAIPAALAAFSEKTYPSSQPFLILHLSLNGTTIALVEQGKLLSAFVLAEGVQDLIAIDPYFLKQPEKSLTTPSASFSKALENLRQNILKTLFAMAKQTKGKELDGVLATGEGSAIKTLPENLIKGFNQSIHFPKNEKWTLPEDQLQIFAAPIGLSLTALSKYPHQINFRQQECSYPNPWKRLKRPMQAHFSLSLFLAFSLYFFGQALIGYKEDHLKEKFGLILTSMNKPYSQFEREFEKKNGSHPKTSEEMVVPLKELSEQELAARMDFLEREIAGMPDIFPLAPNVPRVSDVLAWLSTHPNISPKEEDKPLSLLQIDSFNYTMVRRPEQGKKQEKYQVKVELEFSSQMPKYARELHDALIAPNDFVDPKGEIKWSSNRGKYRTSFYLKDKTAYPSAFSGGK